ncbi:hypothetical protein HD554DRAFT_2331399 [Boletus coccyginus]|nr:hypothetical protein HD554DRAFT_2332706 [Boletus coccyginus]KAI9456734.1 hypothetical protein HD554DRAFT_2331399 [Boletus coccyginus]
MDWLSEFTYQCITPLERVGDEASNADKRDEAIAAYSTALLLSPTIPNTIMFKWADMVLKPGSALEASSAATKDGRLTEAVECFQQMQIKLPEDGGVCDEQAEWELSGWLQPQICITGTLGALTLSIRLQSA